MSNIILIAISLIAGIISGRIKSIPADSYKLLNSILINFCLPAMAILYLPEIKISSQLIFPLISMWIVFFAGVAIFTVTGKIYNLRKGTIGALILTGALCNTAFIGFPMLTALYGEEGLKLGVLIDQGGSFVVLSTFGVIVASVASKEKWSSKKILKDIISYPPFIGFIIGIALNLFNVTLPPMARDVLNRLGSIVSILAMISVGMQLKFDLSSIRIKHIFLGLGYKLIIAPLILYIIFILIFNKRNLASQVSILESAMAPMVMGAILADNYKLDPDLSNAMVAIGIPLSFITIFIWYYISGI